MEAIPKRETGPDLYSRALGRIPGGTQLFSKRPERFLPGLWPTYYSRGKGASVWDLDGNRYTDMSYSGIGSCVLGYACDAVDSAVVEAIRRGSMTTLNCAEDLRLADLLCELHPWASKVRFARSGGEALAIAVRIARAATGKDGILFCGYHGWHDWYLAANLADDRALDDHLMPGLSSKGVPRGLSGTAVPFDYNRVDSLWDGVDRLGDGLAAIVLEPVRSSEPTPEFIEAIHAARCRTGAVIISDEVTAGWRLIPGGAHLVYGLQPDVAVFAKAMSNGYPMAAVIGRDEVMDVAASTFISSTYWTELIGPVAALATIETFVAEHVHLRLVEVGEQVQEGWRHAAHDAGLQLSVTGIPPLAHFDVESAEIDRSAFVTAYTQLMLERDFLATNAFYASFAQTDEDVASYLEATGEAFALIAEAARSGGVERLLRGDVVQPGFKRLT